MPSPIPDVSRTGDFETNEHDKISTSLTETPDLIVHSSQIRISTLPITYRATEEFLKAEVDHSSLTANARKTEYKLNSAQSEISKVIENGMESKNDYYLLKHSDRGKNSFGDRKYLSRGKQIGKKIKNSDGEKIKGKVDQAFSSHEVDGIFEVGEIPETSENSKIHEKSQKDTKSGSNRTIEVDINSEIAINQLEVFNGNSWFEEKPRIENKKLIATNFSSSGSSEDKIAIRNNLFIIKSKKKNYENDDKPFVNPSKNQMKEKNKVEVIEKETAFGNIKLRKVISLEEKSNELKNKDSNINISQAEKVDGETIINSEACLSPKRKDTANNVPSKNESDIDSNSSEDESISRKRISKESQENIRKASATLTFNFTDSEEKSSQILVEEPPSSNNKKSTFSIKNKSASLDLKNTSSSSNIKCSSPTDDKASELLINEKSTTLGFRNLAPTEVKKSACIEPETNEFKLFTSFQSNVKDELSGRKTLSERKMNESNFISNTSADPHDLSSSALPSSMSALPSSTSASPSSSSTTYAKSSLTVRETENNFINKLKSAEDNNPVKVSPILASGKTSDNIFKLGDVPKNKKRNKQEEQNTMVFKFTDRKDVPDYIGNDGRIKVGKIEKPKVSI